MLHSFHFFSDIRSYRRILMGESCTFRTSILKQMDLKTVFCLYLDSSIATIFFRKSNCLILSKVPLPVFKCVFNMYFTFVHSVVLVIFYVEEKITMEQCSFYVLKTRKNVPINDMHLFLQQLL